jgi:hypothetical protein
VSAVEQAHEADEAFGGTVARMEVPPHARAGLDGRGHRFAAYPRCSTDVSRMGAGKEGGMRRTATAVPVMLMLASVMAGADAGDCLAVWVDTQGQAAECAAVQMQKELDHQPDVCAAPSSKKAAVHVKLTSCREQVAAAVPPPGSTVAGREYVIRAQVTEGKVEKELTGLDRNSWAGAVRSLCRAIVVSHGHADGSR